MFEIDFVNDLFGQPRTSSNKQFVILRNKYVYKGPYKNGSYKIDNIRNRTLYFKKWNTPNILLPIDEIRDNNGDIFFIYDNLIDNMENIKTKINIESFSSHYKK